MDEVVWEGCLLNQGENPARGSGTKRFGADWPIIESFDRFSRNGIVLLRLLQ